MTDNEKLDLILSEIQGIKSEVQDTKSEMQGMKSEVQGTKSDIQDIKSEMQELKRHITNIELHLENATDKNIQLIAENYIELTNKLNQAIPAADKNLAYEVKVNYLIREVDRLKEELAELKSKIA